jgi:hypothetical protein
MLSKYYYYVYAAYKNESKKCKIYISQYIFYKHWFYESYVKKWNFLHFSGTKEYWNSSSSFGCLDPQMEQIFHLKYAGQNSTLKFMSDPGGQRTELGFGLEYE